MSGGVVSREGNTPRVVNQVPPRDTTNTLVMMTTTPWTSAENAEQRSAATLCTMSAILGAPRSLDEVRTLNEGRVPPMTTMLSLLGHATKLGLSPTPLEGEYEQLPGVPWPAVVSLREGDREIFVIATAVDDAGVDIIDPYRGAGRIDRDDFIACWTGDVVVLAADEQALRTVAQQLRELTRWWPKLLLWAATACVSVAAVYTTGLDAPLPRLVLALGLAGAFAGSLWLLLFGASCKVCSRGKVISGGLPLEWVGTIAYGALALCAGSGHAALVPLVGFAAGGHVVLMALLQRHGVACKACIAVGSLVVLSAASLATPDPSVLVHELSAAVVGAAALWGAVKIGVGRVSRRSLARGYRMLREQPATGATTATLSVVKRHGCGACVLFETALRPALQDEFGDALRFCETYEDGPMLATPLLAGVGQRVRIVALGLGPQGTEYERLRTIAAALLGQTDPRALAQLDDVTPVPPEAPEQRLVPAQP